MLLAKIVVEKGWLTQDAVEQCVRDQEAGDQDATVGRKAPRPLGVVMVAKGLITDEQLIRLMEEIRQKGGGKASTGRKAKRMLGQILVEKGVVTQDQVREALAEQEKLKTQGQTRRIGEILVEKGFAKVGDVSKALKEQDKTVVACIGCGARYNVVNYKPWLEYRCKKCGALLDLAQEMIRADETTVGPRVPEKKPVPEDVKNASDNRKRQFGKYVLVKDIVEGKFGTLARAWKKEDQSYVGLVLLQGPLGAEALAKTFSRVQQAALKVGVRVTRVAEVGEHNDRHYLCVTLSQ
jgi:hypothetical protein